MNLSEETRMTALKHLADVQFCARCGTTIAHDTDRPFGLCTRCLLNPAAPLVRGRGGSTPEVRSVDWNGPQKNDAAFQRSSAGLV